MVHFFSDSFIAAFLPNDAERDAGSEAAEKSAKMSGSPLLSLHRRNMD
jgi:hypothetical protein